VKDRPGEIEVTPARERRGVDDALAPEHCLASVFRDGDDRQRAAIRAGGCRVGGEIAGEFETGAVAVGIPGFGLGNVGTRDAGGGGEGHAVHAHLDRPKTGGIERPA